MKSAIAFFIASAVLMLVHNHADYLLQAYQHGWWTWLDLHGRAAPWPWYLDVLPRDLWHLVQSIRNHSAILGAALALVGCYHVYIHRWFIGESEMNRRRLPGAVKAMVRWALIFGTPELIYGLSRAVSFSLAKALWN
jgi:Leu/Phe-tRNA-protein transferase